MNIIGRAVNLCRLMIVFDIYVAFQFPTNYIFAQSHVLWNMNLFCYNSLPIVITKRIGSAYYVTGVVKKNYVQSAGSYFEPNSHVTNQYIHSGVDFIHKSCASQ